MKYFVKNKIMTLRGSSYVVDEAGKNAYEVKGKFFTATNKKFIRDLNGNNLYMVRNKYWHFIRKSIYIYKFDENGKKQKLCRIFSPFLKWKIKNYGENNFGIEGGFFSSVGGVLLKDGEKEIGKFGSNFDAANFLGIRDSYQVEVYEPEYKELLIAAAVGLDNIRDGSDGK